MTPEESAYLNPVYPHPAADPFVLKYLGEYWGYVTGIQDDGRAFGILHSTDLVHWAPAGSALDLLPGGHTCYWAPEVSYENGLFYLYYSVGDEAAMQIRAAVSREPGGPFVDSGRGLTSEDFAIDAHVFVDDDGRRYLFYATDFLNVERVGTGTVFDRLLDPLTLAGRPRPVTLAHFDWQVYDPQRQNKGGVRWHTVEGPFVLKHQGRYYQMFSGGNWQNASYGVSYAVTNSLEDPDEWQQAADGVRTLPALRSLPEHGVIGPGHNSVVRGLDNQEQFIVYHRWQPETDERAGGRVMAIDRLAWRGEQLLVHGPTYTPQPLPRRPEILGFERFAGIASAGQTAAGRLQLEGKPARVTLPLPPGDFVCEVSLRITGEGPAGAGVSLTTEENEISFGLEDGQAVLRGGAWRTLELPPGFDRRAFHLLRIEAHHAQIFFRLDEGPLRVSAPTAAPPAVLHLWAQGQAEFAGFAVSNSYHTFED